MSTEFFNDQWRIPSNENQNKISNYSMDFNGSSDKIEAQDASNEFGFSNSSFSLSAWVFIDSVSTQNGIIAKRDIGGNASNKMWYFEINTSSQLRFLWYTSSSSSNASSTDTIPLNTWTHVVVTSNGAGANGLTFYINGTADSGGSKTGPSSSSSIQQTGTPLWIGARGGNTTAQYTNGKIDQVTIFDYALSPIQVASLGLDGYAFNFNGSTQAIDCGTGSRFDIDQITISGWIKRNSSIGDYAIVAGIRNTSNGPTPYTINLQTASSKLIKFVITQSDSTSVVVTSNTLIENDTWYHVAGVADGSNVKLYVNGDLQTDQKTYDGTITSPTQNFNIGRQPSNPLYYWDGELSNISVFNTGLQESDVQTLYNSGKPLTDMSSFTSLQGWWKLDDTATFNSSTSVWTIPDDSSNSNNGLSVGPMTSSSLVTSDINGELISNPMALNPKPIAYYQLGDQSANNGSNYLVPNNSLGGYVFRFVASPLTTSGYTSGDVIKTPSGVDTVLAGATSFTISFWVLLNPATYPNGAIFQTSGILIRFVRYGNSRGPVWMFSMNDGTNSTPGGSTSTAARPNFYGADSNVWYNITCTWDGSTARIYRNAASQANRSDGAYTGTILNSQTGMNFGSYLSGSLFMNGNLSNIAIWRNTALTGTEVSEVYNGGTPLDLNDFSGNAPTSWWKLNAGDTFDGSTSTWTIKDHIGNRDMTSVGMNSSNLITDDLIKGNTGYTPYTLSLDKANSNFFNCGSDTSLQATTALTISAWVKYSSSATTTRFGIVSRQDSSLNVNYELILENDSQNSRSLIFKSTGGGNLLSTGTVQRNVWTHVAVTLDSAGTTIYIGGVPAGTSSAITLSSFANCNFLIANSGYYNSFFPGSLSNIAVWNNTALSPTEILELQNQGLPGNLHNFSGTAPTSWWQMGSNSSFDNVTTKWTCLDEVGINNAIGSANMTNDDIVDGPGYSASGLGTSSIDILGDAPYSSANGLSENMDVLDRTLDTPIVNTHSIQLDGVDGAYVDFGNVNIFERTDAFSGSCWVNLASSASTGIFISKSKNSTIVGYQFYVTATRDIIFFIGDFYSNNYLLARTVNPINASTWYNVAFTYSGSSARTGIKLYVNGVSQSLSYQGPTSITGSIVDSSVPFQISGRDGANLVLDGKIDEVAMFNSELSAPQVASIYNNGIPNNILPLNPVSWHRFESLTTNGGVVTTADSSVNGLTGTVENGAVLSTIVP